MADFLSPPPRQRLRQALRIAHRASVPETARVTLAGPAAEILAHPHIRAAYLGL
jgi:ABC-type branched-subunit amino acid transport system ATPase component